MLQETGIIFDIKHFAVHDGPGIRTTVFFKGCPLSCWWCHNPESINSKPEEIISVIPTFTGTGKKCGKDIVGREATVTEIMREIMKDVIFYYESGGGVTFSGGEALIQHDFLLSLLKRCKEKNIHTCIDTSGYAQKQIFSKVVNYVDLFLYDLKLINNDDHKKYTGVSNESIIQNLKYLCESNKQIFIRIPIIPNITDTDENISQIAEHISNLNYIQRVDILPYNQMGEEKYRRMEKPYLLNNVNPPSEERMFQIREKLESFGFTVKIGG